MTGRQIRKARITLGKMWGFDRSLHCSEFGRVLRLRDRDPGRAVSDWEASRRAVPGPVSLAVELLLAGARLRRALIQKR